MRVDVLAGAVRVDAEVLGVAGDVIEVFSGVEMAGLHIPGRMEVVDGAVEFFPGVLNVFGVGEVVPSVSGYRGVPGLSLVLRRAAAWSWSSLYSLPAVRLTYLLGLRAQVVFGALVSIERQRFHRCVGSATSPLTWCHACTAVPYQRGQGTSVCRSTSM